MRLYPTDYMIVSPTEFIELKDEFGLIATAAESGYAALALVARRRTETDSLAP
jgi:hypothetical protein